MRVTFLILPFLGTLSFSLTTFLEPWFQSWAGNRAKSANLLTVALGDSRRLFAKHFYVKADAYFHSGYYPTIYDTRPKANQMHMASVAGAAQGHEEEEADFLGKPRDWIDAFSRHFFPSVHRHLGEKAGTDHAPEGEHHDHEEDAAGAQREILPWLRLAANLDPERPETYLIASFWLRSR